MKELVEVSWQKDDTEEEPVMVKEKYYLLHFGVKSDIIDAGEGRMIGVSNTVAICESVKTGQLECFPVEYLRILGTELKK